MKVQNEKSAVKRAGVRSAIAGAVGSRWRYAIAGAVSIWRRLAASGQLVGAFERQAAAESAEWQAKMSRAGRMFKAAPAAPAAPATGAGAGAMAAALAAAGVVVNPARREVGAECQTIGALLHGVERPAGPLLQAWQDSIQVPNDLKMCSAFAGRFNSKMVGDGRESLWLHHERGDGWAATMADAIRDGIFALYRWRAGQSLVRDDSGGDVLAVGDSFGEHSSAVVRRVIPQVWSADESEQAAIDSYCGGNWALPVVTYEVSSIASRIAWRALVQSVARDTMGESPAQLRFARDYFEWATGARDWRGLTVEQRRARRLATVDFRFEQLAAGRGQRVKMAGKSKQATVLMLSGMDGEQAAASAGFKSSPYQGSSGARSSLNRMADALKRAGLPVVSRRGNFAQVQAGDFSYTYRPLWGEIGGVIMCLGVRRAAIEITSNRLGGAVKDLAGASVFYAHPTFKQFNFARAKRRLMAGVLVLSFRAAHVTGSTSNGGGDGGGACQFAFVQVG